MKIRKWKAGLLAAVLVGTAVPMQEGVISGLIAQISASAEGITTSGTCGENAFWEYDENTATFTISGTGDMWEDIEHEWYYSDYAQYDGVTTYFFDIEKVVIEDGITSLGNNAFMDCTTLTSVSIPDSVKNIGGNTFAGCTNLTSVKIPDGITSIDYGAFTECESLTSINIPDSVTNIDDWAFGNCSSLSSVVIPDSTTYIGMYAFYWCTNLETVIFGKNVEEIGWYAFENCISLTDVYYAGTEEEWNEIEQNYNYPLLNATIHFNSTAPEPGKNDLLPGDLNGDGEIDSSDAAAILVAASQLGVTPDNSGLTAQQEAAADVDHNGEINAGDAAFVLVYAAHSGIGDGVTLDDVVSGRV